MKIGRHKVKTKITKFGTKSSAKHQIPLMYIAQNSFQKSFKLQKVVNDSRKSGRGLMMLKVDFKTAYDSVNWEGFSETWRQWISTYLASSRVPVQVNGISTDKFSIPQGLRQGYPSSPFQFLIVAEELNVTKKNCRSGSDLWI